MCAPRVVKLEEKIICTGWRVGGVIVPLPSPRKKGCKEFKGCRVAAARRAGRSRAARRPSQGSNAANDGGKGRHLAHQGGKAQEQTRKARGPLKPRHSTRGASGQINSVQAAAPPSRFVASLAKQVAAIIPTGGVEATLATLVSKLEAKVAALTADLKTMRDLQMEQRPHRMSSSMPPGGKEDAKAKKTAPQRRSAATVIQGLIRMKQARQRVEEIKAQRERARLAYIARYVVPRIPWRQLARMKPRKHRWSSRDVSGVVQSWIESERTTVEEQGFLGAVRKQRDDEEEPELQPHRLLQSWLKRLVVYRSVLFLRKQVAREAAKVLQGALCGYQGRLEARRRAAEEQERAGEERRRHRATEEQERERALEVALCGYQGHQASQRRAAEEEERTTKERRRCSYRPPMTEEQKVLHRALAQTARIPPQCPPTDVCPLGLVSH